MCSRDITSVEFAGYKFNTWYSSVGYLDASADKRQRRRSDTVAVGDIQDDNITKMVDVLYVCRWCFKYTTTRLDMYKHEFYCCSYKNNPPGKLVYQDIQYSIRRVNGVTELLFCQCLCLFSRMFLDSKTIYFNINAFEFYIVYNNLDNVPMGFYSREKNSWDGYNLACILVFPPFQRLGLGKYLIAFSYQVSLLEGKTGSPEKPLSSFGKASYLSYWCQTIARIILLKLEDGESIKTISEYTGIIEDDVEEALQWMNAKRGNKIIIGAVLNYVKTNKILLLPLIIPSLCTLN